MKAKARFAVFGELYVQYPEGMAWGQFACQRVFGIPGRYDVPAAEGVVLDLVNDDLDLVDRLSVRIRKSAPEVAVCTRDESVFVRPGLPESAVMLA